MRRLLGGIDRVVLGVALAVVALLLSMTQRYGWHADEFYYVASGKHLAWGYVDNPPLVPFVARVATAVAPRNLFVIRVFPALVAGATVVMGSVVVGELGGRRTARRLGAMVTAAGAFVLGVGHLLATPGFDVLAWLALVAVTCRLLRTQDTRWWLAFGVIGGVAIMNKNLVVMLIGGLAVGLVVERQWAVLRSKWLVFGAGIAVAIALPHIVWQAQHDWPQFAFARALEHRIGWVNRITLLPFLVLFVGPPFVVLAWRGVQWLRGDDRGRPCRALLWAWAVVVVAVLVTGGRPYYAVPITLVLVLAGIEPMLERWQPSAFAWLIVPNLLISVVFALPVLPMQAATITAGLNETVAETIGWQSFASQVRDVRDALPVPDRPNAIVLSLSYGNAGALEFYRHDFDLPPIYSPHNSYADFGQPTNDDAVVIAVRFPPKEIAKFFTECRVVAHIHTYRNIPSEERGVPISVCRGLKRPWSVTWDQMRFFA